MQQFSLLMCTLLLLALLALVQISTLSVLHTLQLHSPFAAPGFEALTGLPMLRCLRMNDCWALPRCLSQLTSLQELTVSQYPSMNFDRPSGFAVHAVEDSLPFLSEGIAQLCHLTSLLLHVSKCVSIATLPANLGVTLPLLRRFGRFGRPDDEGQLPGGMTSLHTARLPVPVAERSMAQLAAAPGLEELALCSFTCQARRRGGFVQRLKKRQQQHAVALLAVQQLPSLRRLELSLSGPALKAAMVAVQGIAPIVIEEHLEQEWQWAT